MIITQNEHYYMILFTDKWCKNGEHLSNCELVVCEQRYKCHHSYCIDHGMVCDGQQDCPSGDDETPCPISSCPGMLRCKRSRQCIHPNNICDGVPHCRHGNDDELFCRIGECPNRCQCIGDTVNCFHGKYSQIPPIGPAVRSLVMKANNISKLYLISEVFNYLRLLDLSNNSISYIPIESQHARYMRMLIVFDLSNNKLKLLPSNIFTSLTSLKLISLHGNMIKFIGSTIFSDKLTHMMLLSVNQSEKLTDIGSYIDHNAFINITITYFYTDEINACSLPAHVTYCNNKPYSGKEPFNIIYYSHTPSFHVIAIVVAVSSIVLNLTLAILYLVNVASKSNVNQAKPPRAIQSLSPPLSNLLYTGYLVAYFLVYYLGWKHDVLVTEKSWNNRFYCKLASFLSMVGFILGYLNVVFKFVTSLLVTIPQYRFSSRFLTQCANAVIISLWAVVPAGVLAYMATENGQLQLLLSKEMCHLFTFNTAFGLVIFIFSTVLMGVIIGCFGSFVSIVIKSKQAANREEHSRIEKLILRQLSVLLSLSVIIWGYLCVLFALSYYVSRLPVLIYDILLTVVLPTIVITFPALGLRALSRGFKSD